jgi:hypothetical protein
MCEARSVDFLKLVWFIFIFLEFWFILYLFDHDWKEGIWQNLQYKDVIKFLHLNNCKKQGKIDSVQGDDIIFNK